MIEIRAAARVGATPALAVGLAIIVLVSLALGPYSIPLPGVVRALVGRLTGAAAVPQSVDTVVWNLRLPRVLAGVLVGTALGSAGAAYQGMFRNPLVSPDILGVSAGAGFGALLGIFFHLSVALIQALAFVFGLGAVALVMLVATRVRRHDPVLVFVLSGVAVGTVFAAGSSLLKVLADPYAQLPTMTYWLLGGLVAVTGRDVTAAAPAVAAGLLLLWLLRWRMNVLSLPDDEALALGVRPERLRLALIAGATLVTAASVAVAGIVGWVGLVVPHVARLLVGPDFRRLLPASVLLGAGFVVAADTVARTAAGTEIPLGILTALAGGPFFLWLLSRSRRAW